MHFYSGSIEKPNEPPNLSFTREEQIKVVVPRLTQERKEGVLDSSTVKPGVCFFMHSAGSITDKPLKLQELVLKSEIWDGSVLQIEENTVILHVYNTEATQKCLKLQVAKNIIEGDLSRMTVKTNVRVSYQKVRTFEGKVEKRISVRLREPAIMPKDILEREFESRMKRFLYMIGEGE